MAFSMKFSPTQPPDGFAYEDGDLPTEAESVPTRVLMVCALISQVNDSSFEFQGFGEGNWHMTVGYEMSALLEELREALAPVNNGREGEIDVYPPGFNFTLHFIPQGSEIVIRCQYYSPPGQATDGRPQPPDEVMPIRQFYDMISDLLKAVSVQVRWLEPQLLEMDPFKGWSEGKP